MRQALLIVFVLLSLLAAATAPVPVAAAQDDGLAPEGVSISIAIQSDGDARWTIATRYNVNDSSDERAFEDVASSFERGEGDVGFSLQTFETVVPDVQERAGRNMSIEDPEWTSEVVNESGTRWGYLRMSFTWTNFAEVRDGTMTLGGVFTGSWFGDLDRGQTLVIEPPDGFDVSSAQPSHETVNGTLRWTGPVNFGPNEPRATFERQPEPEEVPWASIAGAVLTALVVGGIIAYAWFWRTTRGPGAAGATATTDSEASGTITSDAETATGTDTGASTATGHGQGDGGTTSGETVAGGTVTSPGETATGESGVDAGESGVDGGAAGTGGEAEAGAAAGAAGAAAGSEADDGEEDEGDESESEPVPELLSDEERVERMLEENNGRMKQAKIVEETRWSNAKVSQLLSQMADEDRIEKLRIGRENLISLPKDDESGSRFG